MVCACVRACVCFWEFEKVKKKKNGETKRGKGVCENNSVHPWVHPISYIPLVHDTVYILISDDKLLSWDLNVGWYWE